MFKQLFTAALILFSGLLFSATNQLYKINLIVFTQINPKTLNSEYWPNRLYQPNLKNTIELTPYSAAYQNKFSTAYKLLPENKFDLTEEFNRLTKNSDYQIILHEAWIQPIKDIYKAKWIHIFGGQEYNANGKPTVYNPTYWQLNGKIKISKSNFFNINSQLYLTFPENIFEKSYDRDSVGNFRSIPLRSIKFFENRRTKLKELNYFDNPLAGALIQISPLDCRKNFK